MSSSNPHQWTPDVYVSFIASDVGKTFASPLFERLERAGIGFFRNYDERDDYLKEAIFQARFAIVVFSTNYANCSHRLNELVNILLRGGHSEYPRLVVIPIFHGIAPAKVMESGAKDEFKEALHSLPEKEKDDKKKKDENKKKWRSALAKVEGIPGYHFQKDGDGVESDLIETIVERLVNEIQSLYSFKVFGPFGGSGENSWHLDKINEIEDFTVTFKVDPGTKTNPKSSRSIRRDPYEVKLKKDEDIISFSGYFQKVKDSRRIQALIFQIQKRQLRVGHTVEGRKADFSVPLPPDAGKVIEFFGSKNGDGFLTSIGARLKLKRVELPPEVSCPLELFGSRRGFKWDDEQHTTVKGITAARDSSGNGCIRSIAFLYDEESLWRKHGSDTKWSMEFVIDGPGEYLSSISGYCNCDGITSLMFLTNKKRSKTIGDKKGTHFSSPATGYKIIGFYGWSDEHFLHGIGAYFKPISDFYPVKSIGPFGGGIAWDDGKFMGVKEIFISGNDDIRHMKIVYAVDSRKDCTIIHGDYTEESLRYEKKVELNYPKEYLISISGFTRDDGSIQSLTFHSNRKTKTFGDPKGGKYFGYPSNNSRIIGFYGTWGRTLNSIGLYVESIPDWSTSKCIPFEGYGGDEWQDGVHSNVVGFRVTQVGEGEGSRKIESITFMYENNGSLVEGSRHGGGDPSEGKWTILNFPEERLLRIEGCYMRIESDETIIHNLKIVTSDRKRTVHTYAGRGKPKSFDPERYGKFEIPDAENKNRRIVGFSGMAGKDHLNSIGACLEP